MIPATLDLVAIADDDLHGQGYPVQPRADVLEHAVFRPRLFGVRVTSQRVDHALFQKRVRQRRGVIIVLFSDIL